MLKKYMINVLVLSYLFLMMFLIVSHVLFQKKASGYMSLTGAQSLGLLPEEKPSPYGKVWGVERVWFAKSESGYDYRSAYPIIGSVPFDLFGSGHTDKDLNLACIKLGVNDCRLKEK